MRAWRNRLGSALAAAAACLAIGFALPATPAGALVPPTGRSHCTGGQLREGLVEFTHAFDRGDAAALDALFATSPDFQWYTTPGPGRILARGAAGRSLLIPYFERRHTRHDRLRLTSFSFNGNSPHYGNFSFTMRHASDGFDRGRPFPQAGKGAAICDSEGTRFIVLTFGEPHRRH
jgi:hypothetical protein